MINRLKIPEARIGVLIGEGGKVKKRIQKELQVVLSIDSSTGEVEIRGEDALAALTAGNVVKAIGRGFSPESAFRLLDDNFTLEIIQLPKNARQLRRVKSRIIGEEGRAKANIERLTGCDIAVQGRTVAIIGEYEPAERARNAILQLVKGLSHAAVYAMLEKARKRY